MGWRFRKRIKILPGISLNFGKRGYTSTTVGGKWFKTNFSKKGSRNTFSVPGTGLSYQGQLNKREPSSPQYLNSKVPSGYGSFYSWTCKCGTLNAAQNSTCESCGEFNLAIQERNEELWKDVQANSDRAALKTGALVLGGLVLLGAVGFSSLTSNQSKPITNAPTLLSSPTITNSPSLANSLVTNNSSNKGKKSKARKESNVSTMHSAPSSTPERRGSYGPRQSGLIRGPRGGCYYINSRGNKTYVDRSMCD